MKTVSQHLHSLLNQVNTPLWGGYVNMLKTLESAFPSPRHWVLEFLQNSEDAMRTKGDKISIRLAKDSLCILNNGDNFSDDDFAAICDVKSRKLPSLGFRGYIGIGFKSIFRITDYIDVHSGDLHFAFDKDYWDESKRQGIPLSEWPWEILPVPISPVTLPEGFTTGFLIPLQSTKGKETLQEISAFLSGYDFPKEAILLLKNVKDIEIQTPELSFTIAKEQKESSSLVTGQGEKALKELVLVRKQIAGQSYPEEAPYLVFRKDVEILPDIRRDSETERVRRSDIAEREIGLVFALDSATKNVQLLYGKLAGVYSFLPVEGEQTGLPFGIFGDFIPQIGRDLINYGVKWNHWMCEQVVEFSKQIADKVLSADMHGIFYLAELLNHLEYSSASGPGADFWNIRLRDPVKQFLKSGKWFADDEGSKQQLDYLMSVDKPILDIVGSDSLKKVLGKKIVHPSLKDKLKSKVDQVDIYGILFKREVLESLKADTQKLTLLYQLIESLSDHYTRRKDGTGLSLVPFVLGDDDDQFYTPSEVMTLQVELDRLPSFLKAVGATNKKFLHPHIARDERAVKQLERCGLEVVTEQTVIQRTQELVNSIKIPQMCPTSWLYPDDLIKAEFFLFSKGRHSIDMVVAADGSLQVPKNTFAPRAALDWNLMWESGSLAPGYQPIHQKYFEMYNEFGMPLEKVYQYLEELGAHGFRPDKDEPLIEHTGYEIAKKRLKDKGHVIVDVHDQTQLGYDLKCQGHCARVFEVKGMAQPRDVPLEESEVNAAQQKKEDYVLVLVYNLPARPDKVGYKEVPNPQNIWNPVEKARVPKERWLTA